MSRELGTVPWHAMPCPSDADPFPNDGQDDEDAALAETLDELRMTIRFAIQAHERGLRAAVLAHLDEVRRLVGDPLAQTKCLDHECCYFGTTKAQSCACARAA
jgi:hypothetical protein